MSIKKTNCPKCGAMVICYDPTVVIREGIGKTSPIIGGIAGNFLGGLIGGIVGASIGKFIDNIISDPNRVGLYVCFCPRCGFIYISP